MDASTDTTMDAIMDAATDTTRYLLTDCLEKYDSNIIENIVNLVNIIQADVDKSANPIEYITNYIDELNRRINNFKIIVNNHFKKIKKAKVQKYMTPEEIADIPKHEKSIAIYFEYFTHIITAIHTAINTPCVSPQTHKYSDQVAGLGYCVSILNAVEKELKYI